MYELIPIDFDALIKKEELMILEHKKRLENLVNMLEDVSNNKIKDDLANFLDREVERYLFFIDNLYLMTFKSNSFYLVIDELAKLIDVNKTTKDYLDNHK